MNLALRKATKAEVIDAAQHTAIIAGLPKPEARADSHRLSPEAAHYLDSWTQFGLPVSGGMMGVIDLRAMQSVGREAWLEREVAAYGEEADSYRRVWRALDDHAVATANKMTRSDDG